MSLAQHFLMQRTALTWITGKPNQIICMLINDPLADASLLGKKDVFDHMCMQAGWQDVCTIHGLQL